MKLTPAELAGFRAGEEWLYRSLVSEYGSLLSAWVRSFAYDPDGVRDLTQEVWRRVLARRNTYRNEGPFRGWLYSVTRSVCLDQARRDKRQEQRLRQMAMLHSDVSGCENPDLLREQAVQRAIMALPDRQRATLVARLLDELSTKEAATLLGCSEGTVKASLSQAIGNLRDMLKDVRREGP